MHDKSRCPASSSYYSPLKCPPFNNRQDLLKCVSARYFAGPSTGQFAKSRQHRLQWRSVRQIARCFADTFPGQIAKSRCVIGRQHWRWSVHKVPATSPSMWIRPNTARSFTSQLTKSRCLIGQQQHWLMIG